MSAHHHDAQPPPKRDDGVRFWPVGIIHSCFPEKFGIPRQPGMVRDAEAELELLPPFNRPEAVRGLEGFSHVWILFLFHASLRERWRPTVRPPRLGGNLRVGVFASRSPFRPNPIGLSALELRAISLVDGVRLLLGGVDLLDGTPVLDIKPYLPYADSIGGASTGYSEAPPSPDRAVVFDQQPLGYLRGLPESDGQRLRSLIMQVLLHDPRPGYLEDKGGQRRFGLRLEDVNVGWVCDEQLFRVIRIDPWAEEGT